MRVGNKIAERVNLNPLGAPTGKFPTYNKGVKTHISI